MLKKMRSKEWVCKNCGVRWIEYGLNLKVCPDCHNKINKIKGVKIRETFRRNRERLKTCAGDDPTSVNYLE